MTWFTSDTHIDTHTSSEKAHKKSKYSSQDDARGAPRCAVKMRYSLCVFYCHSLGFEELPFHWNLCSFRNPMFERMGCGHVRDHHCKGLDYRDLYHRLLDEYLYDASDVCNLDSVGGCYNAVVGCSFRNRDPALL